MPTSIQPRFPAEVRLEKEKGIWLTADVEVRAWIGHGSPSWDCTFIWDERVFAFGSR
jgi:hypothetical protein